MKDERTPIEALAAMAVGARDGGVPDEVAASVRQRTVDILGICVAASRLESSVAVRRFISAQGGHEESTAIGVPTSVPAVWAALLNGTLAHSLDYDDTHLPSVLHPSATVVPACLAAGELIGASGEEVVAATAVGLEICVRLGMAGYDAETRNSSYFDRGQHATAICGAIGAAAAVGLLLGLDVKGVADSMAVAVSMAGGVIEANRTGGTVKRIHCGWAAHASISAARLVEFGISGPPTVLEGRFGFFRAFLDGHYDAAALTEGLGTRWSVPGISFKPYPANHFCHAGIDAAIALRRRGLRAEDVTSLRLGVPMPVLHTVGEPIEVKRAPLTGYQAQFSGPYTVVAALLGGHGLGLGLEDFTDSLAQDPLRRDLMSKVDVVEDADATAVFPVQFAAVLTATTASGETMEERVMTNRGGPHRPLSDTEIAAKFTDNCTGILGEEEMADVQDSVWGLSAATKIESCLRPLARAL